MHINELKPVYRNWNEVPAGKAIEHLQAQEKAAKAEDWALVLYNKIKLGYGISWSQLQAFTIEECGNLAERVSFLDTMPSGNGFQENFTHITPDGSVIKFIMNPRPDAMIVGQFVDIEAFNTDSDGWSSILTTLSLLCCEVGKEGDEYNGPERLAKFLPILEAYSAGVVLNNIIFFCKRLQNLRETTQLFTETQNQLTLVIKYLSRHSLTLSTPHSTSC
jgi:hypothetical protein